MRSIGLRVVERVEHMATTHTKKMLAFYLTVVVYSIWMVGAYGGNNASNPFQLAANFAGMFAALIGWVCFTLWVLWKRAKAGTESETGFTEAQGFAYLLWPMCVVMLISNWIFVDNNNRVWVIDGNIGDQRSVVAMPFVNDIRWVSIKQDAGIQAIAITKDRVRISARLNAEIRLTADENTILRIAKKYAWPDAGTKQEVEKELRQRFRDLVAKYDLKDLKASELVLEFQTGSAVTESFLTPLGLEWAGTLAISGIHPYFGKDS